MQVSYESETKWGGAMTVCEHRPRNYTTEHSVHYLLHLKYTQMSQAIQLKTREECIYIYKHRIVIPTWILYFSFSIQAF